MNVIIKGSKKGVSHVVVDGVDVTDVIRRFRIEFSSSDYKLLKLKCDLDYQILGQGNIKSVAEINCQ